MNKKLKLFCVLPYYHAKASTNVIHLLSLVEEAAKTLEITLFIEKASEKPTVKHIKHIYLAKFSFFPLRILKRFFVFLWYRLKGYQNFYIHGSYWSAISAALVCRLTGGRAFYWHCEKFENYGQDIEPGTLNKIKWKLLNDWPFRLTLKCVHYLVTGTKTVAQSYHQLFRIPLKKIKIMPNGIDLKRFKATPDKISVRKKLKLPLAKKIILFAHWLAPRKGVAYLPEIIKNVVSDTPDAFFVIIGEGPLKQKLQTEIKKQKLEKHTVLLGKIPHQDLSDYFNASDLFILPSKQEGFPRVLLESMAMQLPFVTTDAGGISDILTPKQKQFMTPQNNARMFSLKVIKLLNSETLQKELKLEGNKRVKDFSQPQVAQIFISLFKHGTN